MGSIRHLTCNFQSHQTDHPNLKPHKVGNTYAKKLCKAALQQRGGLQPLLSQTLPELPIFDTHEGMCSVTGQQCQPGELRDPLMCFFKEFGPSLELAGKELLFLLSHTTEQFKHCN